jgi:hypothetical protein
VILTFDRSSLCGGCIHMINYTTTTTTTTITRTIRTQTQTEGHAIVLHAPPFSRAWPTVALRQFSAFATVVRLVVIQYEPTTNMRTVVLMP